MFIISNNLVGSLPLDKNTIIRINLAWIRSIEEAKKIIDSSDFDIYLDYPDGRNKPPRPVIGMEDAMKLAKHHKVKYFAISNAEDAPKLNKIMSKIGNTIFVPKIETEKGVNNLDEIISIGVKNIMLDKEDLYSDVNCDSDKFNSLVEKVRSYKDKLNILELKGVIFQ